MSGAPWDRTRPAPPVRLVHLGAGAFFRAHAAWYTHAAPDGAEWGYAAFGGRGRTRTGALAAQDGLYTLIERGPEVDRFDRVESLVAVHGGDDHGAWLERLRSPAVSVVTVTVTEAGYHLRPDGGLDLRDPEVRADLDALRGSPSTPVRTAPARLVAGLVARRASGAPPLVVIPCDNVPANGEALRRVLAEVADLAGGDAPAAVADTPVIATVVDRITPKATPDDEDAVLAAAGVVDRCPVVTEPFHEWVLGGSPGAAAPDWAGAGARVVDDVTPYEHRKLWMLNGAHSLLAYAGGTLGHQTVAAAVGDERVRAWVEEWWDEVEPHLSQPAAELADYRAALLDRFANPRIEHRLAQVAEDGSRKVPIRVLPVLRAERAAGSLPLAAVRVLGAWLAHLRGSGAPVVDVDARLLVAAAEGPQPEAARRVLERIDPELAADDDLADVVALQAAELERAAR